MASFLEASDLLRLANRFNTHVAMIWRKSSKVTHLGHVSILLASYFFGRLMKVIPVLEQNCSAHMLVFECEHRFLLTLYDLHRCDCC
jgi:hypothetical protein